MELRKGFLLQMENDWNINQIDENPGDREGGIEPNPGVERFNREYRIKEQDTASRSSKENNQGWC